MSKMRVLTIEELCLKPRETTIVWTDPLVQAQVEVRLPFRTLPPLRPLPADVRTIIVVAGGTLIDETKAWRLQTAPALELIAIPSIWGSGAEASPIAVLNRCGNKEILKDPKLLPDARAVLPDLAASIPPDRAILGCGDCWAHALEGFLSPLADDNIRNELAKLMHEMLEAPLTNDPVWFELSTQACAWQAHSSVGLTHGIAHTLEGIMRAEFPGAEWGHARLCSLLLWPVMRFNELTSTRWRDLSARHGLEIARIQSVVRSLFEESAYDQALSALKENWLTILRDPCTRTNSALVRPNSLGFFLSKAFL